MPDRVLTELSWPLPIQWKGRPAFFERASGLVFVNTSITRWKEFTRTAIEDRPSPGAKSLVERLAHEFYHYLQFFGCGYMTRICADHFEVVRNAAPFPFTQSSLAAYLAQPAERPNGLTAIALALRRVGVSGLSPLHIVEGCAHLFQHLAMDQHLLHGQYLVLLTQSADQDLYGRLYHEATLLLKNRALTETLFLGMCALEFAEPQHAIDVILRLNAKLEPLSPDDLQTRQHLLIAEAGKRWEHLGTAYELAESGNVYHPLLIQNWIFHDAPDWSATIGAALAGHRQNATADCIRHASVVLQDGIYCPTTDGQTTQAELEADIERRFYMAGLSLRFDSGSMEEDNV